LERKFEIVLFLETAIAGVTYLSSLVAFKRGVVDLHSGTSTSINSSALEVACPPPGIGAKKVQEISET
jgi:hypothetical protein